MMRRTRRTIAAALLALGILTPSIGRAAPSAVPAASAPSDAAALELDLSGLEPIDPGLRAELAKRIHDAADEVVARYPLPAQHIHIRVAWQDQDDVDYAVRIHFDAHDGVDASDHPATTGPDASASGLVDVIVAALERSLSEWSNRQAASHSAETNMAAPSTLAPPVVPSDDAAGGRRLGAVGCTGVGLGIAGVGTVAGGVAALVIGRTVDPDQASRLRDWRPAGYALLGIGAAAIVAGTVMAVVDGRARRRDRTRSAMLVPTTFHRGGGVSFSLAF